MLFTLVSIRKIPSVSPALGEPEENKSEKLPKLNLIPVLRKQTGACMWIEMGTWTPAIGQGLQKSVPVILWAIPWDKGMASPEASVFHAGHLEGKPNRSYQIFPELFHLVISYHLMKQEGTGWDRMGKSRMDQSTSLRLGLIESSDTEPRQFNESSSNVEGSPWAARSFLLNCGV